MREDMFVELVKGEYDALLKKATVFNMLRNYVENAEFIDKNVLKLMLDIPDDEEKEVF